ncbi:hypothetical protein BHE74_00012672 [Ensete ventricosum]|nr:hypothetical protein GW17_00032448 [Ensete ventricosum]RWW79057.1 hypothetical protein BHE74_00012672 [Ensete ventricosum]RZR91812.1 hypothetical protein BHM03_00019997 [Ensete ventricosum]
MDLSHLSWPRPEVFVTHASTPNPSSKRITRRVGPVRSATVFASGGLALRVNHSLLVFLVWIRIPVWYQIKLVLVAWLVLPQFRGAAFVYDNFVRQRLRKYDEGKVAGFSSSSPKDENMNNKRSGASKDKDKSKNKFAAFVSLKKANID